MKFLSQTFILFAGMLGFSTLSIPFCVNAKNTEVVQSTNKILKIKVKTGYQGSQNINANGENYLLPQFENAYIMPESGVNGAPAKFISSDIFGVPGENSFKIADCKILKSTTLRGKLAPNPEELTDEAVYKPNPEKYKNYDNSGDEAAIVYYKGCAGGKYVGGYNLNVVLYDHANETIRVIEEAEITIEFTREMSVSSAINSPVNLLNASAAQNWNKPAEAVYSKSDRLQSDSPQNFAKITIEAEGAYYLSAADLTALGIGTSRDAAEKVKIYGYGGNIMDAKPESGQYKELPEQSVVRTYDASGNIDKIIFYAQPAKGLYRNGSKIEKFINPYSAKSYYLISWGGDENGKTAEPREYSGAEISERPEIYTHYLYDETDMENPFPDGSGRSFYNRVSFPHVITNQLYNLDRSGNVSYTFTMMHKLTQNNSSGAFKFYENGTKAGELNIPVSTGYDGAVRTTNFTFPASSIASDDRSIVKTEYSTSSAGAYGTPYLDYYIIGYPRSFAAINGELSLIMDSQYFGNGTEITMTGFVGDIYGWDVSDAVNPQLIKNYSNTGSIFILRAEPYADSSNCFFVASNFRHAVPEKITLAGLRSETTSPDILVITHQNLLSSAEAYADYRNAQGKYSAKVYLTSDIYNEFGCGMSDPMAIRNFIEYKYKECTTKPRFVLLWGDGHFDYRNLTTNIVNFVPTFESDDSNMEMFNATNSYCTDDYFVCVDGNDGLLDLAIGRMPVRTNEDGLQMLEKVNVYENNSTADDWKTRITYIADDRNVNGINPETLNHEPQSESIANVEESDFYQKKKIYSVTYPMVQTTAGRRKPKVTEEILASANTYGSVLMSFIGHGNPRIWTHEEVLERDITIPQFTNLNKLFFCYAATCDFGRFDMGENSSGAEELVRHASGGAIGIMTASRSVLIGANGPFSIVFMDNFFTKNANNENKTMGELSAAVKNASNSTGGAADINDVKYILFGDPAVTLHLPDNEITITDVNGVKPDANEPEIELKGLAPVSVSANVLRPDGTVDTDFNGTAIVTLLDASETLEVPEYDAVNKIVKQGNALCRTSAKVENGEISAKMFIPQDISFSSENATLTIFAQNTDGTNTALGGTKRLKVRDIDENTEREDNAPILNIYLDSRDFVSGQTVSSVPLLIVDLEDDTGINTSGAGIGHKIEAWIDDEDAIDLTQLFKNSFSEPNAGSIEKMIYDLGEGLHNVKVRAWDVFNNFTIENVDFRIGASNELMILSTHMYPNPLTQSGNISVAHIASGQYDVEIKIYNSMGNLIRTLKKESTSLGKVISEFDGYDEYGNSLSAGAYIYSVEVKNAEASGIGHGKFIMVR